MIENNQNSHYVGTSVYDHRMPIITQSDGITNIITNTIKNAPKATYLPLSINNGDTLGVTESLLAGTQRNDVSSAGGNDLTSARRN